MTRIGLRDLSVRTKIAGNLFIIFLLTVATIAGVGLYIQEQQQDARVINLAGRQRMLIQEMVKLTFMVANGDEAKRDDLLATARRYNRTLTALQAGAPEWGIPPAPATIQPQLRTIRSDWRPFYANVRTIAREPRTSEAFQDALNAVRERHPSLVDETDKAVQLYEAAHERTIQTLTVFLGGILVLDVAAMGLLLFLMSRRVTNPITRITEDADAIAGGELDHPVRTLPSDDEIGSLTRSIQEMKNQLVSSLREIKRFQEAIEQAGHSIYITDTNGTIEYVNPTFEEITGYPAEEAVGNTPRILSSGEHDEAFYDDMWETILDGETWEGEVINTRKSGERYIIDQTISPITDADGNVERFVAVNTDITQRKPRQQMIEVLNRVLRHNMRNDMNVITGRADVIMHDRVETLGAKRRAIEKTAHELTQANGPSGWDTPVDAMADDLLETTAELTSLVDRVRADARTIKETGQDLHELSEKAGQVEDVLQDEGTSPHRRELLSIIVREQTTLQEAYPNADIWIDIPSPVSISVGSQLQSAIHELLENAIEHNDHPSPVVTVSVSLPDGSTVDIAIADNGPGIPTYEREVLSLGGETPLVHGGGIGLWLVYWIVTTSGGDFTIDDNDPRGSVVTLSIPVNTDRIQVNTNGSTE